MFGNISVQNLASVYRLIKPIFSLFTLDTTIILSFEFYKQIRNKLIFLFDFAIIFFFILIVHAHAISREEGKVKHFEIQDYVQGPCQQNVHYKERRNKRNKNKNKNKKAKIRDKKKNIQTKTADENIKAKTRDKSRNIQAKRTDENIKANTRDKNRKFQTKTTDENKKAKTKDKKLKWILPFTSVSLSNKELGLRR